jgi:hypothetical protein
MTERVGDGHQPIRAIIPIVRIVAARVRYFCPASRKIVGQTYKAIIREGRFLQPSTRVVFVTRRFVESVSDTG